MCRSLFLVASFVGAVRMMTIMRVTCTHWRKWEQDWEIQSQEGERHLLYIPLTI